MRCPCNLCLTKPICKGLYDKKGKGGLIRKCTIVRDYIGSAPLNPKYFRRRSKNVHRSFNVTDTM